MPSPISPTDLTSERKTELVKLILAQSPPGEFSDILQDVQDIISSEEILLQLYDTIKKRNLENGATVLVQDKETVDEGEEDVTIPICHFNELEDGSFLDPDYGFKISINHFNMEVEEVERREELKCEDELRVELLKKLQVYQKQAFPKGQVKVYKYSKRDTSSSDLYGIWINGERYQASNYRNGQWLSTWTIDRDKKTISGCIRILVHYFEEGNVQLSSTRNEELSIEDVDMTNFDNVARQCIELIRGKEDEIQIAINEAYSQLSESTFKRLRRPLPVTRSKLDWNKLASYKVGDQLASSTQ